MAGVVTNTVFGFLRAYVLLALFRSRTHIGSFDAADTVTYTFLTQGFIATVGVFGSLDLADRIRTGDVVSDLYRPVDFQGYWAAQDAGRAAFDSIFRGIPPFVLGSLVFTLRVPTAPAVWAAFIVSVALAVLISFAYRFIVSLLAFWLIDSRGVEQLGSVLMMFLSGFIVPLTFFPPWLAHVARLLPFAGVVQLPVEVFLGQHRGGAGPIGVLALQLGWAVALLALGRLIGSLAVRKVVVQGG